MKFYLLSFLMLLSWPVGAQSFKQYKLVDYTNQASGNFQFTDALTTAGDIIVVACTYKPAYGRCTTVPTDTEGNTYTLVSTKEHVSDEAGQKIYQALNIVGGTNATVTCHSDLVTSVACVGVEIGGVSVLDQGADATQTTGTSTSPLSPSITTTQANEILLGFGAVNPGCSCTYTGTPSAGFTMITAGSQMAEYRIVAATSSYTAGGTVTPSIEWVMGIVSYSAGGGGGGGGGTGPTITSAAPVVNQAATFQFTADAAGSWACSGTTATGTATSCAGSINSSTGLYTAPATVSNQQYAGGMQLMPNNHIYNTRVDSLALRSDSATLIAGAGTTSLNYLVFAPPNYATGATPTESQTFFYTDSNNGSFQIPAYPNLKIENGYFSARTYNPFNVDHHMLVMDTGDGTMQEIYQHYPEGSNTSCALCTSQSGVRYKNYAYALSTAAGGTTDAAGLYLWPLMLRKQELELAVATGTTINHAIRMTLQNGYLHNAFLWPATAASTSGSGVNFYGERVRLKSTYSITSFSAIAQVLLTQLKQYGMIIADGGAGWQPSVELTRWTKAQADAFREIQNANIGPSNFEVVDEAALQLIAGSGETTRNREIVTFTRTSDSATTTVDVVLRGVAVNLPSDVKYFQAGTAAFQLTAYNNIGTLTWAMSPTLGTLTSGGLYTPPASATCNQKTTVTATSATNSNVKAVMQIVVYPAGTIYLVPGQSADYTDSTAHVWCSGETAGGDTSNNFGSESAYGYDNGGSWPTSTDITLYKIPIYALGDIRFDVAVANGTYAITAKLANNNTSDQGNMLLETQGTVGSLLDVFTSVGGNAVLDVNSTATVSGGILSFVLRPANTVGNGVAPFISALKIAPTVASTPPVNTVVPVISGSPVHLSVLSTTNGTWTGTAPITFTYAWQRCNTSGTSCSAIGSATASTYTLATADIASTIRIVVTATNGVGAATSTSAATSIIAAAPPVNTVAPSITGTQIQGQVLTAVDGTWTGTSTISFTYQWRRCDSSGNTCADRGGATMSTYTVVAGDVNSTLRVVVTGTNGVGAVPATSAATNVITAAAAAPVNTVVPTISGSPAQGQVLTADAGTWTGTPTVVFTYQWQQCNASGASCTNISGATSATYTLLVGDVGSTIRIVVTGTNATGNSSGTSVQTVMISASTTVPANTVLPVISGTLSQGSLLSTTTGTWTGSPTIAFTYQWQRCTSTGTNCASIGGATNSTYNISFTGSSSRIVVIVTGTNIAGSVSATSAATGVISPAASTGIGIVKHEIAFSNSSGNFAKLIPQALITVCPSASTGTPCSPTATIYTGPDLATEMTNPFMADANGNFTFWLDPNLNNGKYKVSVTKSGYVGYTYDESAP